MSIKNNILFIGGINQNEKPQGGEEFKNQLLLRYLEQHHIPLTVFDTHHWRKKPILLLRLLWNLLFVPKAKILVSITTLSAYKLLSIIHLIPGLANKTIYLVIGGNLPKGIANGMYKKNVYQNVYKIIVQGRMMLQTLKENGVEHNVQVIPNFKPIPSVWRKTTNLNTPSVFKFVFMSSIIESKGVPLVLQCIQELRKLPAYATRFKVDFYGPFESSFELEFKNTIATLQSNCAYKGYLDIMGQPQKAYAQLSEYDAFLFPSTYHGEGFPGVLIDAMISGLPIIASDWNMNREVVEPFKTGFVIEANQVEAWCNAMKWMMDHPDEVDEMRTNCNHKAKEYDIDLLLDTYFLPLMQNHT